MVGLETEARVFWSFVTFVLLFHRLMANITIGTCAVAPPNGRSQKLPQRKRETMQIWKSKMQHCQMAGRHDMWDDITHGSVLRLVICDPWMSTLYRFNWCHGAWKAVWHEETNKYYYWLEAQHPWLAAVRLFADCFTRHISSGKTTWDLPMVETGWDPCESL